VGESPAEFAYFGLLEDELVDFVFLTLFKGFVIFPSQERVAVGAEDVRDSVETCHQNTLLLRSCERCEDRGGKELYSPV
jgi:hypothetical protein